MIVRCGNCRAELEVAGPGEFLCPACGTRNMVRGAPAANPFGVPDLGGSPAPGATAPATPASETRWVVCPSCGYRFAVGEVEEVVCPSCSARLSLSDEGATLVST
jgi:DNA-directed RNA polymerase subunit RPC12/RpoP